MILFVFLFWLVQKMMIKAGLQLSEKCLVDLDDEKRLKISKFNRLNNACLSLGMNLSE